VSPAGLFISSLGEFDDREVHETKRQRKRLVRQPGSQSNLRCLKPSCVGLVEQNLNFNMAALRSVILNEIDVVTVRSMRSVPSSPVSFTLNPKLRFELTLRQAAIWFADIVHLAKSTQWHGAECTTTKR
jgi:hypothetical protein